jgi:hypothetical protein
MQDEGQMMGQPVLLVMAGQEKGKDGERKGWREEREREKGREREREKCFILKV